MYTRGDLHIHSTASDGDLSPYEIVMLAKERCIDTIALTDHNTTSGISEAVEAGRQYKVAVIPAVELSTRYRGQSIHLLGYFKSCIYNDDAVKEILKLVDAHSIKKVRSLLKGFIQTDSSGDYLSIYEGIVLLKSLGAAVVLAHPIRINLKILIEILNMPFDGIEAKYCLNTSMDTSVFISTALTRFSFYTGGSDFHTNRRKDFKHHILGQPYLDSSEIQSFIKNSGALVL